MDLYVAGLFPPGSKCRTPEAAGKGRASSRGISVVGKSWKVSFSPKESGFCCCEGSLLRDLWSLESKSFCSLCLCSGSCDARFFGEEVGNGCLNPVTSRCFPAVSAVCGECPHGQSPSLHAHGILSLALISTQLRDRKGRAPCVSF